MKGFGIKIQFLTVKVYLLVNKFQRASHWYATLFLTVDYEFAQIDKLFPVFMRNM